MSQAQTRLRRRMAIQGFVDLPDSVLAGIDPWLRLSPALCMLWVVLGTVLQSPWILAALLPFALAGGLARSHPFDALYNQVIRRFTQTSSLPPHPVPRRFACLTASAWIAATSLAFALGKGGAATALGMSLAGVALVNVATGFCLPSWLYSRMFGSVRSYRV